MNLLPWRKSEQKAITLNQLLTNLEVMWQTQSGERITPDTCMQSPTIQAIVQAVSRRISVSPVEVIREETGSDGRVRKEKLPNHPVAKLFRKPNPWQTPTSFWLDATSSLIRYGNFVAWKGRGSTGPIRRLMPLSMGAVNIHQDVNTLDLTYRADEAGGARRDLEASDVFHARGPARNFYEGDSPVMDIREVIGLEVAAEKHGASFFKNGALPLLYFMFKEGSRGFKNEADEQAFLDSFQRAFGGENRFRGMIIPAGLELNDISTDHEKSQFIETQQYYRTVIAGAFGVPPHLVGDLSRGTFNNVEQQSLDFTMNVVLPYTRMFEDAAERDLLTDQDRNSGVIVRFNLDKANRADFKSRQEGKQIQRQNGVISPNEWREDEDMNPISAEDGGDDYLRPGNMLVAGEEPEPQDTSGGTPFGPQREDGNDGT